MRDKLGKRTKNAFSAFVGAIGTAWNFLFLKTQDPDESDLQSNEIRQDVMHTFFETDKRKIYDLIDITVKNEGSDTKPIF